MKFLTLFLSLLLITTNAYAEWAPYSYNINGDVMFYDKSTVKRIGNKVRVWNYINYSPNNKNAKDMNIWSMRTLEEVDCVNETHKPLSIQPFTEQNLKGDPINVPDEYNPTTTYIPPDSVNAVLMKLVCKK